MVPSQTGDDALSTVPVDEYETVFSSRERCAVNVHSAPVPSQRSSSSCRSRVALRLIPRSYESDGRSTRKGYPCGMTSMK